MRGERMMPVPTWSTRGTFRPRKSRPRRLTRTQHVPKPRRVSAARIYQRPKSSMQSGRARTREWVLEFARAAPKRLDPLTGWWGSGDTNEQVTLTFPTRAAAEAYATHHGLAYDVHEEGSRALKLQAYADNFR